MNVWVELTISFFLIGGALFALLGAIGLARLPDFYTRVHAPTMGTTLGVGGTIIGSVIYFSVSRGTLAPHELIISMFLFITAPVTGHLLAKAAILLKVKQAPGTRGEPSIEREEEKRD
ncbi:Na+/H+ antiporter subunit G [Marinimicrobium sp. C2-29]|uniref:Na+/H+ antiporter subunit G n=1 Tax=Marinimicrobium sp. C2-29 TaxID=3139825 RepID=UPI0031393BB8